jgi:hypothetical protein
MSSHTCILMVTGGMAVGLNGREISAGLQAVARAVEATVVPRVACRKRPRRVVPLPQNEPCIAIAVFLAPPRRP